MVVMPRCCKTLYMDANGIQKLSMNVQVSNFSEGLKDRLGGHLFTSNVCALCWLNDLMHYI